MNPTQWATTLSIGVFLGMLACLEIGYRLGRRNSEDSAHEGIGAIEASVFALLGLLLGFSLAGGTSRLDTRRELIVEEANHIGPPIFAWICLPPPISQLSVTYFANAWRRGFASTVDSRI
jgi:hypothetical protein